MSNIMKIKENRDFRRAYGRGKSFVSPYVVIYILKNRTGETRLGITTGKKIGNAVSRNRARRVITAAFSECFSKIATGFDIVIVARPRILTVKSTVVATSMLQLFKTAGLYAVSESNE